MCLTLPGQVLAPLFVKFLAQVARETETSFTTADLLVLDAIHGNRPAPKKLCDRLAVLTDLGAIEKHQRKYILAKRFYEMADKKGQYTRKRGLDRETNKALLLRHIEESREQGSPLRELMDVLPSLSRDQIQSLLRNMKRDGIVRSEGRTRAARWYPAAVIASERDTQQ